MLYGSYGTQNSLVTSISKFGPRKGQDQVKLGQVRSNFQIKIYLQRHAYLVHFCLRISKMSFALMYDNYKCHKMRYKSDVITLSCFFFAIAQPKIKILFWNLNAFCVCILMTYIPVFWYLEKFWISSAIIFWKKTKLWVLGAQNREMAQFQDSHFAERSILRHLAFFDCVLLQNWTL